MRIFFRWIVLTVTFVITGQAVAKDKVVVVPLLSEGAKKIGNVVTVAKYNGDYPDVLSAMASIRDASQNNPYLMVIGPGKYAVTETLHVKPYVSITGSGERITELLMVAPNQPTVSYISGGAVGTSSADTFLSNLTIENRVPGAANCTALEVGVRSTNVRNVALKVSNCSNRNVGFDGVCGFSKHENILVEVNSAPGANGSTAIGVSSCGLAGRLSIKNSEINAGGSGTTIGLSSIFTGVSIEDTKIFARGGSVTRGIKLEDTLTSTASQVRNSHIFTYELLPDAIGIEFDASESADQSSRTMVVEDSWVSGNSSVFGNNAATFNISHSTLIGSASGAGNAAIKTCVFTDNGDGLALPSDCVAPVMKR